MDQIRRRPCDELRRFKGKVATYCAALALIGITTFSADAQTQSKKADQRGATDQMLAQLGEPENYRATMIVHVIPTGNAPKLDIPPLRFNVARMGADRRWSFRVPQIGEVIYLEDGPQKYLILPARNQYVDLDPSQLNVPLPWAVSPTAVIENIRKQSRFERVGPTVIHGRRATTYKATGAADTGTRAGRVKNETVVSVGERAGLPLRVELDNTASTGAGVRVIIETESIDTNPQAALFDVPTGMNKVTTEEIKQEVNSFINMLRALYDALLQLSPLDQPHATMMACGEQRRNLWRLRFNHQERPGIAATGTMLTGLTKASAACGRFWRQWSYTCL